MKLICAALTPCRGVPGLPRLLLCGWLLITSGCASLLPETTPFGAISGVDARRSLNGLAVHKKMWELAGAKCLTPKKLSPRLEENLDVIVLVGQSYSPPGIVARDWLESWLSQSSGRSVIYFGRDFNASLFYRQQTLNLLPADQLQRGEVALAQARVDELNLRLRELPENTFCRWFYLDGTQPRGDYTAFTGPWSEDIAKVEGTWPVGVRLQTPDEKWQQQLPSWLAQPATPNSLTPANPPAPADEEESAVQRSSWEVGELSSAESWNAEFGRAAESSVLLSGADGQPLVYRLTHGSFGDGQILIVANGAPFLNGSLVAPLHRVVGEKIIEQCLPAKRVALLAYDESGILISRGSDADDRAAGLEVLTVWPLSAITMPAALLGILICIVLSPILGRPQSAPRRSVSDFGLHISALGRMLFESRDLEYAKKVIAEYYRTVRVEAPPYWLDSIGSGSGGSSSADSSAVGSNSADATSSPVGSGAADSGPADSGPAVSGAASAVAADGTPPSQSSDSEPIVATLVENQSQSGS